MVIAVCKDSVTMLTTLEKEQLNFELMPEVEQSDFKEILSKFVNQNPWNRQKSQNQQKSKEDQEVSEKQNSEK